jgi:hypothetical protein
MGWLLLFVIPAVMLVGVDVVVFRSPPPWLTLPESLRRRWARRRRVEHNPFEALRLQLRLSALAAEILRLESDRRVFAKAHRVRAAQIAYDQLLAEACRLAGVEPVRVEPPRDDQERLREELELASRGWSW